MIGKRVHTREKRGGDIGKRSKDTGILLTRLFQVRKDLIIGNEGHRNAYLPSY